jgi:hypothetical protein
VVYELTAELTHIQPIIPTIVTKNTRLSSTTIIVVAGVRLSMLIEDTTRF